MRQPPYPTAVITISFTFPFLRAFTAGRRFCSLAIVLTVCCPLAAQSQATQAPSDSENNDEVEEIVISSDGQQPQTEATELTEKLLDVPGTFGDPFGAIFALPGVVAESEEDGEPAVRGTGPEDNAFLIDFLPASYVFHDLGVSIFNEHLIRDFGLKAAGFGPEYDQATGAIFDVTLREPRPKGFESTIDLSFLKSGFLVEGGGGNHGFYLSARQSLIHLLLEVDELLEEDIELTAAPRWSDLQGKYSWTPDESNRLSLLLNGTKDGVEIIFGDESEEALLDPGLVGRASLDTRFSSLGLLWDSISARGQLRVGIGNLDESTDQRIGDGRDRITTVTQTLTAKADYLYLFDEAHSVRVGGQLQRTTFDYDLNLRFQPCTRFEPDCEPLSGEVTSILGDRKLDSYAAFAEYRWQPGRWTLKPGARYTHNEYLAETFLEPRLNITYAASENLDFSLAYGRHHQLPFIDQIVPDIGNQNLDSPRATHLVAGALWQLDELWSLNIDLYRKDLDDLVVNVDDDRNYVNAAHGTAYGLELLLNRQASDRWYGWATLSVSRSERINDLTGQSFRADYDTPVVINVVANYRFEKWSMGFSLEFAQRRALYPHCRQRTQRRLPRCLSARLRRTQQPARQPLSPPGLSRRTPHHTGRPRGQLLH